MIKRVLACLLATWMGIAIGLAWGQEGGAPTQPAASQSASSKPMEPRSDTKTTTGTWTGGGRSLPYTAIAGYLPLKDEREKLRANIYFTSYTAGIGPTASAPATMDATSPRRPIMFLFNGGPGAASAWLHLGAAGPMRIDIPEDGTPPKAPYRVVENPNSWLPVADLVFVDPVNTGYSRAATPEQAKEFFGVKEDVDAMGEFIRVYMTKYGRWGSPVFLAGESYGTTRAAALANYLQERVGVSVSGVILMSTVLNFALLEPGENNDIAYAAYLPSYAAVAWYHKKAGVGKPLDQWLRDAEDFTTNEYMAALGKGAALSPEDRAKVAARVAELTGLRKEYVLESNLRVHPSRFEKELLRSPSGEGSLVVGRFDGRLVGPPTDGPGDGQEYDPSLSGFYTAYTSAFNDYVRRQLKYENDIAYEVLSNRVQPWNFGSGGAGGGGGFLYVGDDLRDAMTHNPQLRLLVCSGRFDLATPYFATEYQIDHMTLAPEIRKNITMAYYLGGHMMYHVKTGIEKLHADVTAFVEGAK